MTAGGGDPGEKPGNEGRQPPGGGHEAPPIEDTPAYGGYEFPATPSYSGSGQPGGFPPEWPPAPEFPPPVDHSPSGYPPPSYPPPEFPPPVYPQYGGAFPTPAYPPPPEFGAPYPGWQSHPPAYPPGYPGAPQGGTNKLAIGSLVASVLGLLCCIGSVVGIVLGAVAINQIKWTRQEGYGLAVAGIVVGVATLLISIVWMTFAWN